MLIVGIVSIVLITLLDFLHSAIWCVCVRVTSATVFLWDKISKVYHHWFCWHSVLDGICIKRFLLYQWIFSMHTFEQWEKKAEITIFFPHLFMNRWEKNLYGESFSSITWLFGRTEKENKNNDHSLDNIYHFFFPQLWRVRRRKNERRNSWSLLHVSLSLRRTLKKMKAELSQSIAVSPPID